MLYIYSFLNVSFLHFLEAPDSAPAAHQSVSVSVHYELYAGAPLMAKWVSVETNGIGEDGDVRYHKEFKKKNGSCNLDPHWILRAILSP